MDKCRTYNGVQVIMTILSILSDIPLVNKENEKNGRFFLYPTSNMYNFILLDQIDGRTWQVQWSTEEKNRMVLGIYKL